MQPLQNLPSRPVMIQAILAGDFAVPVMLETIGKSLTTLGNRPALPTDSVLQAGRDKLEAMSDSELALRYQVHLRSQAAARASAEAQKKAKVIADARAKEAARFYNHANAMADLAHWAKAEYWTFEEAIALLLGREPKVLTAAAVRKELASLTGTLFASAQPTPAFLIQYEKLVNLARRATAMTGPRLNPKEVIAWALRTGAVTPPQALLSLAPPEPSPVVSPEPAAPMATDQPTGRGGSGERWTRAAVEELNTYLETHTLEEAAVHYGVHRSRIGEVRRKFDTKASGPKQPNGNSAFHYRPK